MSSTREIAVRGRVVDIPWLTAHLADPAITVVEVTADARDDGDPGRIPGSRAVYWKRLCWHPDRREFATAADLDARLTALGASGDGPVVLAGSPTQYAAYALWVAHSRGLGARLRYLDGGVDAWQRASDTVPRAEDGRFTPPPPADPPTDTDAVVGRDAVAVALDDPATILVDLRSPEEFSGLRVAPVSEPIDHGAERAGRIPGARSLHVLDLLDEFGRIRPRAELLARIARVDLDGAQRLIFYCRLAHRAALGWLIFGDVLGDTRVRVYDGSWTEWGNLVGARIER